MPRKKKRPRAEDGGAGPGDNRGPSIAENPSGPTQSLRINAAFAERYDAQKRRELLASVPAAVLENGDNSSSDDEEEDELGELLTKKVDRRIHETLEALRAKDPRIYDKATHFFANESEGENAKQGGGIEKRGDADGLESNNSGSSDSSDSGADDSDDEPVAGWDAIAQKAAEASSGKVTLKDYVRENLLQDGKLSDSDSEGVGDERKGLNGAQQPKRVSFADAGGGALVRASTVLKGNAGKQPSDNSTADLLSRKSGSGGDESDEVDDNDDQFFTKKEKTKEEAAQEDVEFEEFLAKQAKKKGSSSKPGDDLLLHSYLQNETPDEKECFLRDFVLNNGWLARGNGAAPGADDYKIEIDKNNVRDTRDGNSKDSEDGGESVGASTGSEFEDQVDAFEHNYNFRFEEPDGARLISHARSVDGSLRRPDDRRKRAREARKNRKEHEKLVKTEEIKHLKNLKKKEIETRLTALRDAAGDGVDFTGIDLDADFDPEEFSKQMESRFGDEYYERGEGDAEGLEQQLEKSAAGGDGEVNAKDKLADQQDEFSEDVKRLVDEYYNLNYEDIIGGTPVRFRYKKVDKESFNMESDDILAMDDKDLNRRVSLKYIAPYRSKRSIPKRAFLNNQDSSGRKKRKADRKGGKDEDTSSRSQAKTGRTDYGKRHRNEDLETASTGKDRRKSKESRQSPEGEQSSAEDTEKSNKKKKKRRKEKKADARAALPSTRRAAYGL